MQEFLSLVRRMGKRLDRLEERGGKAQPGQVALAPNFQSRVAGGQAWSLEKIGTEVHLNMQVTRPSPNFGNIITIGTIPDEYSDFWPISDVVFAAYASGPSLTWRSMGVVVRATGVIQANIEIASGFNTVCFTTHWSLRA